MKGFSKIKRTINILNYGNIIQKELGINSTKFNFIFANSKKSFTESNLVNITYKYLGGKEVHVRAPIGENLLIIAKNNNVELEGACDCSLACSTCHLILEQSLYDKLEEPSEDETNLLSLSGNYCETSRLGCQIKASKELEGSVFKIPFDPI